MDENQCDNLETNSLSTSLSSSASQPNIIGNHLTNTCELLEKLGNRFPKLKEQGDKVQKVIY